MIKIINRVPYHCCPPSTYLPSLAWQSFDSNPRVSLFSPITTLVVSGVHSFEIPMVETIFSSVLPFLSVLSPYSFIDVSISIRFYHLPRFFRDAKIQVAPCLRNCSINSLRSLLWLDRCLEIMIALHRSFLFVFVFILFFLLDRN